MGTTIILPKKVNVINSVLNISVVDSIVGTVNEPTTDPLVYSMKVPNQIIDLNEPIKTLKVINSNVPPVGIEVIDLLVTLVGRIGSMKPIIVSIIVV